MGGFLTVSMFYVHEVPVEDKKGRQTPGNWSYIKSISTRRVINVLSTQVTMSYNINTGNRIWFLWETIMCS